MAEDLEGPDFRRILHMGTDTGASVVIPHADDPERLGGIFRQLAQVHEGRRLFPGHILDRDVQVPADESSR